MVWVLIRAVEEKERSLAQETHLGVHGFREHRAGTPSSKDAAKVLVDGSFLSSSEGAP